MLLNFVAGKFCEHFKCVSNVRLNKTHMFKNIF
jgi:hypothetical protein